MLQCKINNYKSIKILKFLFHPSLVSSVSCYLIGWLETLMIALFIFSFSIYILSDFITKRFD